MNYQQLDEYVAEYGLNNETDIDNMQIAIAVNKIRKDKENDTDTI